MKNNSLKNIDTFILKLLFLSVAFLFIWNSSLGQVAPSLGATSSFAVFTATGAFTVVGAATDVTGDVGTNVGSFTGFPPGILNGQIHVVDATSSQAATDVVTLYDGLTQAGSVIGVGLGNEQILTPGVYQTGAASTLNGNLTLNGQNNTNSLFIIRIGGALSTGSSSTVTLTNGASISNVYWQVNGQFDLAASSVFAGITVVNGAINLLDSAKLFGKALSKAGAINLLNNEINKFTWTGATNTDWNTLGNWIGGIPTSLSTVIIPNVTNKPIINNTSVLIESLTIDASSSLTINAGKDLTINDYLINNGTFTINSDASTSGSLIVTGSSTGNITYNRYTTGITKWHLFGSPVGNQDINSFVTTAGNIATSGVNYNLAPYDNTLIVGSTTWKKWTTDGTNPVSSAGNFVSGKGYEILTTTDGTVPFTGTVPVAQVTIAVTGTTNRWNLIGNPFPSSIPANSAADAVNNFLTVNSAALDPSFVSLYLWNPSNSNYDLINQQSALTYIAPGQGFFVKAVTGEAGIVNFTTAMRTNQAAVVFQKVATPDNPSIVLSADNHSGKVSTTAIKYSGGMHLGLDPGYDAGRFGGASSSFGLYSHLVEDNDVDFAIQALPDNSFDTTVIPIGLDASAGTQVSFKANITNLPLGKKVFLEDRLLNSFTELNQTDKAYTLTLSAQSTGIGRFFLHTQDNLSTLAVAAINALKFGVIALPLSNSIRVIGAVDEPASLDIYDTLGRFVFTAKLKASNNNEVVTPTLANGIYIVKIKTAKSNFSTKIVWY